MLETGGVLLLILALGTVPVACWAYWRSGYTRGWNAARTAPPTCPTCGYSMSGLSHCRCPECGVQHTLDELTSANGSLIVKNRVVLETKLS